MKVYLAKSNKSLPENVSRVRNKLTSLGMQVMEFNGGAYSDKDLVESEKLVVVPDSILGVGTARIGKGLLGQIETFKVTNGADNILVVFMATSQEILVSKFIKTEVVNPTDWTDHGRVYFREDPENIHKLLPSLV